MDLEKYGEDEDGRYDCKDIVNEDGNLAQTYSLLTVWAGGCMSALYHTRTRQGKANGD
jgi:hypothetical protein